MVQCNMTYQYTSVIVVIQMLLCRELITAILPASYLYHPSP